MKTLTLKTNIRLTKSQTLNKVDGNEGVILDFNEKFFRGLNETALFLLEELDKARMEKRSLTGELLVEEMLTAFDAQRELVEEDVLEFLLACLERKIIEVVPDCG